MSIWRNAATIAELQERSAGTLIERLGIRFTQIGPDFLCASMPVNDHTRQPRGVLHGGASVALAETVGSTAANLCVDAEREVCLGQEINANHLRPVREGFVTAMARSVHRGRTSQVWQIEIRDERERLVCISRITMAVVAMTGEMRVS
jgi:1,4-dihydroxy-2-naphthoyl-CoA hydrolase